MRLVIAPEFLIGKLAANALSKPVPITGVV